MRKIILIGMILAGMTGFAQADVKKVVADIASAPAKLQTHIKTQIEDAKEYGVLLD